MQISSPVRNVLPARQCSGLRDLNHALYRLDTFSLAVPDMRAQDRQGCAYILFRICPEEFDMLLRGSLIFRIELVRNLNNRIDLMKQSAELTVPAVVRN